MKNETLNFKEVMESRRHAIAESLHTVSLASLREVADEFFPDAGHTGLMVFLYVIDDPESGPFYHAMADDRIHIIYAHGKKLGMWFARDCGTEPLQAEQLKIMNDIVGSRP